MPIWKSWPPICKVRITPVIITNQMDWASQQDQAERAGLLQAVEQWRKDWASRDTDAYLKHYAPNFSSNNMNYPEWAKQKQLVNSAKSMDQGGHHEYQHVRLSGTARYGGSRLRAGLQQQQSVQPDEETPILDQTGQGLENNLRGSRMT